MLYVKSIDGYKTVCASFSIKERMVVYTLSDNFVTEEQTRTTIKVAEGKHVEDAVGRYINHSCNPNVKIDGFNIVAIKDICENDEIFFDYSSEGSLAHEFVCNCCGKRMY
tara:strand:- start:526 stop:855 length:330 start_codon:yes stop_codon:yes gene_type:complete